MKSIALSLPFALGLALTPLAPAAAQRVNADIIIGSGPISGRVVVGDHVRRYPPRRVVVRRYAPRPLVIYRVGGPRGRAHGWYRRHGYRPVTVYYRDGHYYDRIHDDHDYWGDSGFQAVVLWRRGDRYYQADDYRGDWDQYRDRREYRDDREHYRGDRNRYRGDRDRYRGHDGRRNNGDDHDDHDD